MRTKEQHRDYMREYLKRPHVALKAKIRKAKYREANKETLAAKQVARYYAKHDEELAKRQLRREANREEIRAKHREYCREWREKNRLKLREKMREYQKKPEQRIKQREVKGRRRALEKASKVERISYLKLKAQFDGICNLCKMTLDLAQDKFHYDHIIPIAQGGPHTQDNLQIVHKECNLKKNKY